MLFSIKIEKVLRQKVMAIKVYIEKSFKEKTIQSRFMPTLYCFLEINISVPYGHFCPLKNVPNGQSIKKD